MKMNTKLSIEKIVNKKFQNVINGYAPNEVDELLDTICSDYEFLEKQILDQKKILEELNNEKQLYLAKIKELEKNNEEAAPENQQSKVE